VPADDVGCPHMVSETGYRVLRPVRNLFYERSGLNDPCFSVFRRGPLYAHTCGEQVIGTMLISHDRVMCCHRISGEGHVAVVGTMRLGQQLGDMACRQTE
jgi:hypothetical protein